MVPVRSLLRNANGIANARDSPPPRRLVSRLLAAVFVPRVGHPPILHVHLPMLCKLASIAFPQSLPIRLVSLPKGAEERLASSLCIPQVGLVGIIEGAPGSAPIIDYVRQHVQAVQIPWPEKVLSGLYLPVEIKTIRTTDPIQVKDQKPGRHSTANEAGDNLES